MWTTAVYHNTPVIVCTTPNPSKHTLGGPNRTAGTSHLCGCTRPPTLSRESSVVRVPHNS